LEAHDLNANYSYPEYRAVIRTSHHHWSLELADDVLKLDHSKLTDVSSNSVVTPLAAAR